MPSAIIPETFGVVLAAFSGCFRARSYRQSENILD